MDDLEDVRLPALIAGGDREAFEALYRRAGNGARLAPGPGQGVTRTTFVGDWSCHGIAHGSVTLVMTSGPDTGGIALLQPHGGLNISRIVGRFSFRVP